jgi:hypothetical protein
MTNNARLLWAGWVTACFWVAVTVAIEASHVPAKIASIALLVVSAMSATAAVFRKPIPVIPATVQPTTRVARPWRDRCYLVVHLDLKVTPPAVAFVHTYSCSAKDLTHTGAREARADLYMVEADTFQAALDEMRRVQPLYFPWVTPYLTRNR